MFTKEFDKNLKHAFISVTILGILVLVNILIGSNIYRYNLGLAPIQPVEFSHKAHIEKYNLKCLHCHFQAEYSSMAGVPSTYDCLFCHNAIRAESEKMKLVNQSIDEGFGIKWKRINRIPAYSKFNHSSHLRVLIDCSSCHGEVEKNDTNKLFTAYTMKWCLDCHRDPIKYIVPARDISGIWGSDIGLNEMYKNNRISLSSSRKNSNSNIFPYIGLPAKGPVNCSACHY